LEFINKTIKWGQSIPLNEYNLKITDKFPDVYIQSLENTLVLEVKCGEIIQVENACGFTLRFPRVVKIRNDKSFKDCMTSKDIQEMFEVSK
jgi:DNA ligase-4